MPTLCELFSNYIVYMYCEQNTSHNKPHIHIRKPEINLAMDFNGNVLEGDLSKISGKDLQKIQRWILWHKDELQKAWQEVLAGNHPEKISSFIPPRSSENETNFSSVSDFKQEYTTSMEVSVSKVFTLPEYRLLCEFDNGTFILYNAAEWLDFPAFSPLKTSENFKKISVVFGNPTWTEQNEEITAYDIYVDGIKLINPGDIAFLKYLSSAWTSENDFLLRTVTNEFLKARHIEA